MRNLLILQMRRVTGQGKEIPMEVQVRRRLLFAVLGPLVNGKGGHMPSLTWTQALPSQQCLWTIEDQGGVVLSGTDKHGNRIRLEWRVADVHRPLIAGSYAAKITTLHLDHTLDG